MDSLLEKAKRVVGSLAILGLIMPGPLGQATLAYHGYVDKDLVALQQPPPGGPPPGAGGTAIITVTVQDSAGTAVQGAFVSVHPTDFKYSVGGSTGANGQTIVSDFGSNVKTGDSLVMDVHPPFNAATGLISPDPTSLGAWTGTAYAAKTVKFKGATKTVKGVAKSATGEAVANQQINFFKDMGGFANTKTDTSGAYTVKLSGGRWNIFGDRSDTYVWAGPPDQAALKDDDSTETLTIDLDNFVKVNATITGKVKTPDGKALPQGMGLNFAAGHDMGFGVPLVVTPGATEVAFTAKVPGDRSYAMNVFSPPSLDQNTVQYGPPKLDPITVKVGATVDIGTVALSLKDKAITVKVANGSAGMMAFAFSPKSQDFGFTQLTAVGADAEGTIKVSQSVEYMVMAMGQEFGGPHGGGGQHGQTGTSKLILEHMQRVTPPGTASFTAINASSTITGTIKNKTTGAALKDAFGMIEVSGTTAAGKEVATFKPLDGRGGGYSVKVPAMSYLKLKPMIMNSGFMQDDPADEKDLPENTTRTIDIGMVPTDATLNVKFVKPDGSAISGLFAHAMATNGSVTVMGDFARGGASQTNIKVVAAKGPYRLLVMTEPGAGFVPIPPKDKVTVSAGETKEVKVTFKPVGAANGGATLKGKVTDPDGNAVVGVKVRGDNGFDESTNKGPVDAFLEFSGVQTDKDGNYELPVAAGEQVNVRVAMSPKTLNDKGWMLSKETVLTPKASETVTQNFQLRKADVQVTGVVKDSAGKAVKDALVSMYTDDGSATQTRTDANGKYTLNAPKDTKVHIDSRKDASETNILDLPGEKLVDTTGKTGLLGAPDITVTEKTNALVADTTKQTAVTNTLGVDTKDGFRFESQANAFGTKQEENVTVNVNVTGEMPSAPGAVVVGDKAYDITASLNGEPRTSANAPLTMKIPAPSELPGGVKAEDVKIASNNPETGETKIEATTYVDPDPNKKGDEHYLATMNHLTTFGLVASADTTPAAEVKDAKATAGDTKVTLSWTNPTDSDFDSVEIYRSTATTTIGDKIKTTAKADTSYDDTGLTNGTAYYYTFKSRDTAGNVSAGTDQVSTTPSATAAAAAAKTLPKTGLAGATTTSRPLTANWYVLAGLILAGIGALVIRRRLNGIKG